MIVWGTVPENATAEYEREVSALRAEAERIERRKADVAAFEKWQSEVAWRLRPVPAEAR